MHSDISAGPQVRLIRRRRSHDLGQGKQREHSLRLSVTSTFWCTGRGDTVSNIFEEYTRAKTTQKSMD